MAGVLLGLQKLVQARKPVVTNGLGSLSNVREELSRKRVKLARDLNDDFPMESQGLKFEDLMSKTELFCTSNDAVVCRSIDINMFKTSRRVGNLENEC